MDGTFNKGLQAKINILASIIKAKYVKYLQWILIHTSFKKLYKYYKSFCNLSVNIASSAIMNALHIANAPDVHNMSNR